MNTPIKNNWKLISYPRAGIYRLYNLKTDPQEMNNLVDNPEYKTKLHDLRSDLWNLDKSMNDPFEAEIKK